MLKIAVIYNKKPSIGPTALNIIAELKKVGYLVSIEKIPADCDLVLALGGDGTFLRAAQAVKTKKLPILAVRLGRLGFLAELNGNEVLAALETFKNKKYTIDKRYLLEVIIKNKNKKVFSDTVLNEAVISRDGIARIFDIKVVNDGSETVFHADGIIISTPTGSTAYNLSAGGPILGPENEKYIITPICPHAINWRSLVVDNTLKTIVIPEIAKAVNLVVTYDGHRVVPLTAGSILEVKKSEQSVNFIRFKPYNFKKIFMEKFGRRK
jgi:NAD+ kinase